MNKTTPKEIKARLNEEYSDLQDNLRTPLKFAKNWLGYITLGVKTNTYGTEKNNPHDF